jgi:hypothetical protein
MASNGGALTDWGGEQTGVLSAGRHCHFGRN